MKLKFFEFLANYLSLYFWVEEPGKMMLTTCDCAPWINCGCLSVKFPLYFLDRNESRLRFGWSLYLLGLEAYFSWHFFKSGRRRLTLLFSNFWKSWTWGTHIGCMVC